MLSIKSLSIIAIISAVFLSFLFIGLLLKYMYHAKWHNVKDTPVNHIQRLSDLSFFYILILTILGTGSVMVLAILEYNFH